MKPLCDQYDKSSLRARVGKERSTSFVISCRRGNRSFATSRPFSLRRASCIILFLLIMDIPQNTAKELQQFFCKFLHYRNKCNEDLVKTLPQNGTFCPGEFDGFMCWPHSEPGALVEHPCPDYVNWNNDSLFGYRWCNNDGTWFTIPAENGKNGTSVWGHRDQCNPFEQSDSFSADDLVAGEENLLNVLKTIYTIGYTVSLVFLVIAILLLVLFKRLHCTRNYIHINLMVSFIIRYVVVLIKDQVIEEHYRTDKFNDNISELEMMDYCDDFNGTSGMMISCRVVIGLMHYAVVANYFWLLVEGLYLLMLLVFTMSDYKFFPAFMAFGWGGPWIPVGIWIVLHFSMENVGCWELDETSQILWTLRIPIIIAIAANFLIFINIVRIIVSKLRAKNMTRNDYKYRLAKSTLALIPLLGIHYIVFIFVNDEEMELRNILVKVKVAFEMALTSIQGTLIALLYCFLNGDVKHEVKKVINKYRLKHGLPAVIPRKSSTYNSSGTQVTTLVSGHPDLKHNHMDTIYLSPTDKRDSIFNGRRSTDTSGDQSITTLDGATEPLISNGLVDVTTYKNENVV